MDEAIISDDGKIMNIAGDRDLTDSPCIGICSATALGDEICIGCRRTFEEVCRWNFLSNEEKIVINLRLAKEWKRGR